jgi:hypothetical protein
MLEAQLSQRPTDLGRTVAVDLAGPGGAEILRAAVVSYRRFFNQFLFETLNLCYLVFGRRKKAAPRRVAARPKHGEKERERESV